MQICVEFDDLCDNTLNELVYLKEFKEKYPTLKVTLFTIPMRCEAVTIKAAQALGDWVQLAPHGWRHTHGECLSWTKDEAVAKIKHAADVGIGAPVFRAPGWLLDADVYAACQDLGYTIASHKLFRIPNTGVREYVYNQPKVRDRFVLHGHLTNSSTDNYIGDMASTWDELAKITDGEFVFPQDIASVITTRTSCAF